MICGYMCDNLLAMDNDSHGVHHRFKEASIAGMSPQTRWNLVQELLESHSMNFVSTNFRSFFLMSKQEFKKLGVLEAVRIDMEVNTTPDHLFTHVAITLCPRRS